jgi:hypothetical protein
MSYKVTAEVTFVHGTLLPAHIVMPINYEVEHWEESMTMLFATAAWQASQAAEFPMNVLSIKFTYGQ